MKTTGNTILITCSGAGIGHGLAESSHQQGNEVTIAGRRQQILDEVTAANPGVKSMLNINDQNSIPAFCEQVVQDGCVAKTSDSLVEVAKVPTVARPTHLVHEPQAPVQVASFSIRYYPVMRSVLRYQAEPLGELSTPAFFSLHIGAGSLVAFKAVRGLSSASASPN